MKQFKTIIVLMVAALFVFSGCEKSELIDSKHDNNPKNTSFLNFKNKKDIENALEIGSWEAKPEDFISMYDIYIQIEETEDEKMRKRLIEKHKDILKFDEDSIIDLIISDPVLASFLSPKGLVKVGNEISLVKKDKIITLTDGDASKIELLYQFEESNKKFNIRVDDLIQINRTNKAEWSGTNNYAFHKKFKWEKWALYSPWNSSAGGKIKSYSYEKKLFGSRWVTYKTNLYLHVRWDRIVWGQDGDITRWDNGHIYDSKHGWFLSERRYRGAGWTPNPVYGLTIDGSVNGYSFNH